MDANLIKRLIATIKCGKCGQNYHVDHVKIIEQNEDIWFLRVYCPSCDTRSTVAAIIKQEKSPEFVTGLTETEVAKFKSADTVAANDVLDMHRFLDGFDGDFAGLFR
jgi:transcription elongation factor Elf1